MVRVPMSFTVSFRPVSVLVDIVAHEIGLPVLTSGAVPMPPTGGMVFAAVLLASCTRPLALAVVTAPQTGANWMVGMAWSQRPFEGSSTLICVPTSQARLPAADGLPRPSPWQVQLQTPVWTTGSAPVQAPPGHCESKVQGLLLLVPPWQKPSQPYPRGCPPQTPRP